ncbi:hypothetical protein Cgig2_027529 [Carnegiea gigantea]|uniref:Uncharacterized protein n=1 Tax=Carnegiea gigantea TaxID=171969 RepID=A0A9Q1JMM9_9CARY|nr:hypothetical protein Cgig2_027529 [Carnegiea gigantea]
MDSKLDREKRQIIFGSFGVMRSIVHGDLGTEPSDHWWRTAGQSANFLCSYSVYDVCLAIHVKARKCPYLDHMSHLQTLRQQPQTNSRGSYLKLRDSRFRPIKPVLIIWILAEAEEIYIDKLRDSWVDVVLHDQNNPIRISSADTLPFFRKGDEEKSVSSACSEAEFGGERQSVANGSPFCLRLDLVSIDKGPKGYEGAVYRFPHKFVEYFKGKLARECTLRGPSGNEWQVRIERTNKVSWRFSIQGLHLHCHWMSA